MAPQGAQAFITQRFPATQAEPPPPGQQAWPGAPQGAHMPDMPVIIVRLSRASVRRRRNGR
jgi:hypothetical protein